MSTITSPRPNPPSDLTTPTTSSRPSLSLSDLTPPSHQPPLPTSHQSSLRTTSTHRNRAALRDYYGLKSAAPIDASSGVQHAEESDVKDSELDREGFDAEGYVRGLLEREGIAGLLGVEGGLVGEIKGLDGERKALVYDNYSKLITATDTIRKMRTNMAPLSPTTSTLSPAISHIAEIATSLATSLQEPPAESSQQRDREAVEKKRRQQETVGWVLGSPRRLRKLLAEGKREEAEAQWGEVKGLLGRWEGVEGVREVRAECVEAMEEKGEEEGS